MARTDLPEFFRQLGRELRSRLRAANGDLPEREAHGPEKRGLSQSARAKLGSTRRYRCHNHERPPVGRTNGDEHIERSDDGTADRQATTGERGERRAIGLTDAY